VGVSVLISIVNSIKNIIYENLMCGVIVTCNQYRKIVIIIIQKKNNHTKGEIKNKENAQ
jgi:hypothetical protein